jgi:hypothetical protein
MMILYPSKYKTIDEFQQEFNRNYPYLRIEFEQKRNGKVVMEKLPEGAIEIAESTTVQQLQKSIRLLFGIPAQIFRKSGKTWLATTMTDHWTLLQQNQHGEEISAWALK